MEYTVDHYKKVLSKAAEMKYAIDELECITENGISSWTSFGKALDAIYKARDEYIKVQYEIAAEVFNT